MVDNAWSRPAADTTASGSSARGDCGARERGVGSREAEEGASEGGREKLAEGACFAAAHGWAPTVAARGRELPGVAPRGRLARSSASEATKLRLGISVGAARRRADM
jgi:hypothetical protein